MKINQILESQNMCNVCGQTSCNCTHVTEGILDKARNAVGWLQDLRGHVPSRSDMLNRQWQDSSPSSTSNTTPSNTAKNNIEILANKFSNEIVDRLNKLKSNAVAELDQLEDIPKSQLTIKNEKRIAKLEEILKVEITNKALKDFFHILLEIAPDFESKWSIFRMMGADLSPQALRTLKDLNAWQLFADMYRQSQTNITETGLMEFAPNGDNDGDRDPEDVLFRFAKMWYSAPDVATQQRVEQALAKIGWEIGELESEEGGAFVMRIGDAAGDSYIGWSEEDLAGGLDEGANDAAPKMGAKERKLAQGAVKGAKDMSAALGLVRGKDGVARLPKDKKTGVAEGSESEVIQIMKMIGRVKKERLEWQRRGYDTAELDQDLRNLQRELHSAEKEWERNDQQGVAEAPGAETLAHNQSTVASNEKAFDLEEGKDKKPEPPEADYGDDYQAMVGRVKKLAGLGPLKTVYDPAKRVYKNVPTAVQPKK